MAKQAFCTRGMPNRECHGVPDDATCSAVFDQAWTECTRGVVLHSGPSDEDREAGRKAAQCIGGIFREKFGVTQTDACMKALQSAGAGSGP